MLSITGRVTFSAATHFGVAWPTCQLGAWASSVLRTGSAVIRGSVCALRLAETWPALSVHSATWSVIQRTCAHAASRRARSAVFTLGKLYWWVIDHTVGCLKSRGSGATVKSTFASRRPVKFHEPAIQRPRRLAMKASRQLALAGG